LRQARRSCSKEPKEAEARRLKEDGILVAKIEVPVTPEVLDWAIRESGYGAEEVAEKISVHPDTIRHWLAGRTLPTLTNVRALARLLKRTPSTFLLPAPPPSKQIAVEFRRPPREKRKSPNPDERRYVREAARLQEAEAWIVRRLGQAIPTIPETRLETNPDHVAQDLHERLIGSIERVRPETAAKAFNARRSAVEASGVSVFLFPMGADSAAGFSLWNENAPVIAVNTALNHEARSYTLFHEYGHLLTRTSSLCLERSGTSLSKPTDRAERWCEEFAASILLPWADVAAFLKRRFDWRDGQTVSSLSIPKAVAMEFHVSWRAATIRLIERGLARWELYRKIPPLNDEKHRGGRSDVVRDRGVVRESQYGRRTVDLFIDALGRDILARTDIIDYLDVTDAALDRLEHASALLRHLDE
jgi:Zn-dependent peptidase ImmA (M78 family)